MKSTINIVPIKKGKQFLVMFQNEAQSQTDTYTTFCVDTPNMSILLEDGEPVAVKTITE